MEKKISHKYSAERIYKSSDQVYICMKVKASDNFGNFWMVKKMWSLETILFLAHKLNILGSESGISLEEVI